MWENRVMQGFAVLFISQLLNGSLDFFIFSAYLFLIIQLRTHKPKMPPLTFLTHKNLDIDGVFL